MRYLIDTCTFIWIRERTKTTERINEIYSDETNDLFLSIISPWEIAIKESVGKSPLKGDWRTNFSNEISALGIEFLPIKVAHTLRVADLPLHHRDPFDRMLVAQCMEESLTLLTPDPLFRPYGIPTIWD